MTRWITLLMAAALWPFATTAFAPPTPSDKPAASAPSNHPGYTQGQRTFGGTGKYYLGREISQVMGHMGADWLERDSRETEEKPSLLLKSLKLKPGDNVADIGSGTGYFTRRIAKIIQPEGTAFAVDIQPEMHELLQQNMAEAGLKNFKPILGKIDDPKLPKNTIDLALMVDVYHEFSHPFEMIRGIVASLKPGGRVVFVEYRLEDPSVPIKRLHKMSEAQVRKEARVHDLEFVETLGVLPRQHIVIFRKK